jgi:hypothetical protein
MRLRLRFKGLGIRERAYEMEIPRLAVDDEYL